MKIAFKSLFSFVVMFSCASIVSANTIYNVNRTVGGGAVSGFIETDGALGVLSNANLLDWQLTLTSPNLAGGSPSFIQKSNPNGSLFGISGNSVSASATDLYFDFSGNNFDDFILYSTNAANTANSWWCLISGGWTCVGEPAPSETIGYGTVASYAETQLMSGIQSIASVNAIPEPEIYAMLGAGLGLMGWAGRRKKLQAAV